MFCDVSPLVVYVMRGVLILCGVLVVVLMQMAEHDRSIKRVDSLLLRNARRIAFIAIAGGDAVFMVTLNPWALVVLFAMTAVLLGVDIVGLGHRPTDTGHEATATGRVAAASWTPLRRVLAVFRSGGRLSK